VHPLSVDTSLVVFSATLKHEVRSNSFL